MQLLAVVGCRQYGVSTETPLELAMPLSSIEYYDQAALLDRLTMGIKNSGESVVFLVGSAVTAPLQIGGAGVPNVQGVIDLIKKQFPAEQTAAFEREIQQSPQPYQAAFSYLIGRRGQTAANNIIKRAVMMARLDACASAANLSDADCDNLDQGNENWFLNPAVKSLGRLVALQPEKFGQTILTTNFDPLLEVAIRGAGALTYRTVLHREGNLNQTHSEGCHVVHLHGYWHGTDTLHTNRQLNQSRPRLKSSIKSLVESKILVVVGYGGWDDTFTEALQEIIQDDTARPEIIWTFFAEDPPKESPLIESLSAGLDRGRVSLYRGIDCHSFFPALLEKWEHSSSSQQTVNYVVSIKKGEDETSLTGREEDRPPLVEFFVGREKELDTLTSMSQRAVFLTGFGGQGKSTIAARYFALAQQNHSYDEYVWRDCKEEGERFENQLIDIIVRLSGGHSSANYLAQQSMETLAELLAGLSRKRRILFVFDNVDHYVDLERNSLAGNAAIFLSAYLSFGTHSQLIFTCRPDIQYLDASVATFSVPGLNVDDTAKLFAKRGVARPLDEMKEVHELTRGHAFWLDLIAAQVSKKPTVGLRAILDQLAEKSGSVPASVLSSLKAIWSTLDEAQRLVLQTMAETVRPEAAQTLGDYLSSRVRYNRVTRALRGLRDLNLIVIKSRAQSDDLFDLHPLVREFIRQTFPLEDRVRFIDAIIAVYVRIIKIFSRDFDFRSVSDLQYFTENAELLIEAEKYEEAFERLSDVAHALYASATPGEFSRVARKLFRKIDWNDWARYKSFDHVFDRHFRILVNLSREGEYAELLERYAATMPVKDARYINYCALKSNMHWTRSEFPEAVKWAEIGKDLKDRTNVDTRYSTDHELALAQRDVGRPELAIKLFLGNVDLDTVLDPDEFDEEKGESFYGNVGRCLHLMDQIDPALVCYRKSALMLERAPRPHSENRAFVRTWIGELLISKGEICDAKVFLESAEQIWNLVSPFRSNAVRQKLIDIEAQTRDCLLISASDVERYVLAWINERKKYFVGLSG